MSPVPQTESHRRVSGIWLPDEPSEEELARHWTLSEADRREVSQCRGDENRRRFGVQLCVLRNYGRLLESGESVPTRIVNHLGAQLQLPPVLFAAGATRPATETEYTDRIRRYLGYRSFDSTVQRELAAWAEQRTLEGLALVEVALRAEELLRTWLVVLPRVAVFVGGGQRVYHFSGRSSARRQTDDRGGAAQTDAGTGFRKKSGSCDPRRC